MNARACGLLVCFATCLAASPAAQVATTPRTSPGKVVTELVEKLRKDKTRFQASKRLVRMGTPAVEPLLAAIEKELEANDATALPEAILDVLEQMGPKAAEAGEPLLELYEKTDAKAQSSLLRAAVSLAPYCKLNQTRVLTAFKTRLRTGNAQARTLMNTDIQQLNRLAVRLTLPVDANVDELIRHLRQNRQHARCMAAELLAHKGKEAMPAIDALAETLEKAGEPRKAQGPVFATGRRPLRDDFQRVGSEALIRIAPRHKKTVIAHANRLKYMKDEELLRGSILALASYGKSAARAVPDLVKFLSDRRPTVAGEAATALGAIGLRSDAVLKGLSEMTKSKNRGLSARAKAALRALKPKK